MCGNTSKSGVHAIQIRFRDARNILQNALIHTQDTPVHVVSKTRMHTLGTHDDSGGSAGINVQPCYLNNNTVLYVTYTQWVFVALTMTAAGVLAFI
jgi:hypothetical protein